MFGSLAKLWQLSRCLVTHLKLQGVEGHFQLRQILSNKSVVQEDWTWTGCAASWSTCSVWCGTTLPPSPTGGSVTLSPGSTCIHKVRALCSQPAFTRYSTVFSTCIHKVQALFFMAANSFGPAHAGCGAPCNTRTQIMEHIVVNGSVHTACKQHQRFACKYAYGSCANLPKGLSKEFIAIQFDCANFVSILFLRELDPPVTKDLGS